MCAAREPRRFNGLCDTCCWFGHLSCDCLLQRDRISDVPTLSSPPQSNSGGPGYDIPCYPPQQTPPSYSGRNGGPGYDIPCYPPQQTPPSYSGRNGGPGYDIPCYPSQQTPPSYSSPSDGSGYDIPCYPPQQTPPSYSGRSGGPGYDIPCHPPQQRAPRPFSSFVRSQRYNGGHSTAPPQHKYCGSNNGYGINEGPQQQYGRGADGSAGYGATFPQQQPGPRPFSSFGWEQRYACRDGPQQSAPTAVTLAAAAPATEVVTGTRVFPAVSSKGVAEAPASSAGAELAAVPAAAPATGGTVFTTASVGGAARAHASADGIATLTAAPATGGTVPFAASVGRAPTSSAVATASAEAAEPATSGNVPSAAPYGGQSGRASRPLERCHLTRQRKRHHRPTVLLPLLRQRRGSPERSRQQLGPMAKSATRGGRPPTPLIPVPCVRWRSTSTTAVGCSMAVAAAAAAAAATTTPVTTTPGGMQPALEHCCDSLIRGNYAGEVRGEQKRFKVWIFLLIAGKHGSECSMDGDGLRAEGEFLAFIWLVSRTTGESRVRKNSGRFGLLNFILDGYFRV